VLVTHDLLGLFDRFTPRFVKKYADLYGELDRAFSEYIDEVENRSFPAEEHNVAMNESEWEAFLTSVNSEQ